MAGDKNTVKDVKLTAFDRSTGTPCGTGGEMKTITIAAMIVLLTACGSGYSSDNCAGVDTSQQPFRIQRIEYPGGHYSITYYYENGLKENKGTKILPFIKRM